MGNFGEFLKTWSLLSNSVTRQVTFIRTKNGGKCQNSKIKSNILSGQKFIKNAKNGQFKKCWNFACKNNRISSKSKNRRLFCAYAKTFLGSFFHEGKLKSFSLLSKFPLEMTHPVLKLVHFCSTCASAFFHSVCFTMGEMV